MRSMFLMAIRSSVMSEMGSCALAYFWLVYLIMAVEDHTIAIFPRLPSRSGSIDRCVVVVDQSEEFAWSTMGVSKVFIVERGYEEGRHRFNNGVDKGLKCVPVKLILGVATFPFIFDSEQHDFCDC